MELNELFEARRNPEVNIKEVFDFTEYFDGRYYVSFTSLPKLGIRPKAEWTTPHGVCAYPLFLPEVRSYVARGSFPFASDRPYVNVMMSKGKELLLSTVSQTEIDHLITIIEERYGLGKEALMLVEDRYWGSGMKARLAITYWGLTEFIAMIVSVGADKFKDLEIKSLRNEFMKKEGRSEISVMWNKALRGLGYDLITDDVGAVIHYIEPYQTIFLNPRAISLIDRSKNPLQNKKEIVDNAFKLELIVRNYNINPANLMVNAMYSYHYPLTRKYEIFVLPTDANGKVLGKLARELSDIHIITDNIFMTVDDIIEDPARYGSNKLNFFKSFIEEALDTQQREWVIQKLSAKDEVSQDIITSLDLFNTFDN